MLKVALRNVRLAPTHSLFEGYGVLIFRKCPGRYFTYPTFGAFALTCLVIELTPGPNMAYLAVLSAGNGRRAGFAATLGIALGLLRDAHPCGQFYGAPHLKEFTKPAGSRRRALLRWVQIALKPASRTLGLHGVFIRGQGLKYVITDSTFKTYASRRPGVIARY
jgi:hypothetical protein